MRALRNDAEERGKHIPGPSFLSHTLMVHKTWPELFSVDTKKLPYDHYRQLAVTGLPEDHRDRLRQWAESENPPQRNLRQRIRQEVDALQITTNRHLGYTERVVDA